MVRPAGLSASGPLPIDGIGDGRFVCRLCPRRCRLAPGSVGVCGALACLASGLAPTYHGAPFALQVSSAERPGPGRGASSWLVLESPGSGLERSRPLPESALPATDPEEVVFLARVWGCDGVLLETEDPLFGVTAGGDVLRSARRASLRTAVTTSGYLLPEMRERILGLADVIDLRLYSLSPPFYRLRFAARPEPVFATVEWLRRRPGIRVGVSVPLFENENDRPDQVARLARFVVESLGPATPLRFVAGDERLPPSSLHRATAAARGAGLAMAG